MEAAFNRREFEEENGYYVCGVAGCVLEEYHAGECAISFQFAGRRRHPRPALPPLPKRKPSSPEPAPEAPPAKKARLPPTVKKISVLQAARRSARHTAGMGPARLGCGDGFFDATARAWGTYSPTIECQPVENEITPDPEAEPATVRLCLRGAWWKPPVFTAQEFAATDAILAAAATPPPVCEDVEEAEEADYDSREGYDAEDDEGTEEDSSEDLHSAAMSLFAVSGRAYAEASASEASTPSELRSPADTPTAQPAEQLSAGEPEVGIDSCVTTRVPSPYLPPTAAQLPPPPPPMPPMAMPPPAHVLPSQATPLASSVLGVPTDAAPPATEVPIIPTIQPVPAVVSGTHAAALVYQGVVRHVAPATTYVTLPAPLTAQPVAFTPPVMPCAYGVPVTFAPQPFAPTLALGDPRYTQPVAQFAAAPAPAGAWVCASLMPSP